ncbi:unnamed protein product [Cunninghamella blakesleeana]
MSKYTREKKGELLKKCLGPEFVLSRPGAGGSKVMYITGDVVINLANEVFGYDGWSSEIRSYQLNYEEKTDQGKYNIGISTVVRITLKASETFHEDIGFGAVENARSKEAAFALARKQSATDGLKRAFRKFGNLLGNCLYDKPFLNQLSNMAKPSKRYAPDDIYRFEHYHQSNNKKSKIENNSSNNGNHGKNNHSRNSNAKHSIPSSSSLVTSTSPYTVPSKSATETSAMNTNASLVTVVVTPEDIKKPSSPSLLISENSFVIDEDDEFYANLANGAYNEEEFDIAVIKDEF